MGEIKYIILISSFFFCHSSNGQKNLPSTIDTTFFSWTPSVKHKVVNGIAIGLTAHPWSTWTDTTFVKINGVNLEIGPAGIIGGIWGTMFGLIGVKGEDGKSTSFFSNEGYYSLDDNYPKYGTHLNGFSISVGGVSETYNHGVFINGLSGIGHEIDGIQVSGLINITTELKGASIALLANVATKAKGIQIGLINKCNKGSVLQIGLFNRIGKRVTPIINFRFKKEKLRPTSGLPQAGAEASAVGFLSSLLLYRSADI